MRFGFFVTGMLRLRRRTSASFGPVRFSFGTPVSRTATRSSRLCSGTSSLYSWLIAAASSGVS